MTHRCDCAKPQRLAVLRDPANSGINGIDYVEVTQQPGGATLVVQFVRPVDPASLGIERIRIEGGVRFGPPLVISQSPAAGPAVDRIAWVTKGATDFSAYTLRLVKSIAVDTPPPGFDPELSEITFDFKADCPSDFDCERDEPSLGPVPPAPPIDYLAKDYESFRRLMLDRLSVTSPDWRERNPADLGIAVVEVLAHAADALSYMQDAVATEAYLGTARRRTSVRRHARLLDYPMHDGCNARAFVHLEVAGQVAIKVGTPFLIRRGEEAALPPSAVEDPQGPVFEAMEEVTCWPELNEVEIHDYFDRDCVLRQGATRATLIDRSGLLSVKNPARLRKGALLAFEEIRAATGVKADADPSRRALVRLTEEPVFSLETIRGPGEGSPRRLVEVVWGAEDALPFDFPLTAAGETRTVVRGNLVLVDHGRTLVEEPENLVRTETGTIRLRYGPVTRRGRSGGGLGPVPRDADNRPLAVNPEASARAARQWPLASILPEVRLEDENGEVWLPEADLLGAGRYSRSFVVESEDDGEATLRFGDGRRGAAMPDSIRITYRVGNGTSGMVGEGAIAHVANGNSLVLAVRNPWPAFGGCDPEPIRDVKLYAPFAFQKAERAVTDDDYAEIARRHPQVQRAVAYRRWNGSWTQVVVLIDRADGLPLDDRFRAELAALFERVRLAGYDVEFRDPIYVPLDLVMTVCVEADGFRAHVHEALRDAFSNAPGGFFDPDRLTFGQSVFLSEVVERAMRVAGVKWVDLDDTPPKRNRFHRFGRPSAGEFLAGQIALGPSEIARLDNDANRPENGRIEFILRGGR